MRYMDIHSNIEIYVLEYGDSEISINIFLDDKKNGEKVPPLTSNKYVAYIDNAQTSRDRFYKIPSSVEKKAKKEDEIESIWFKEIG